MPSTRRGGKNGMTDRNRILRNSAVTLVLKVLATAVVVIALMRWAAEMLDAHTTPLFWAAVGLALAALCAAAFGVFSIVTGIRASMKKLEETK
jgi:membrane-associated HD superfamily phosphohydrolase